MAANIDRLLLQGREAKERHDYLHVLMKNFGDWIKKRQIKIAEKEMAMIKVAVEKVAGHPVKISTDENQRFPVSISTGLTINEPHYAYTKSFLNHGNWPAEKRNIMCKYTSELVIKARGHKVVMQGGKRLQYTDHHIGYLPVERIVAKGRSNIIRYLGALKPS